MIKLKTVTCVACDGPIKPIQGNYCSPMGDYCLITKRMAKSVADYLWEVQASKHPKDNDTSYLYMFLDHNIEEALTWWFLTQRQLV